MAAIKLMNNSASFSDASVNSATVSALRSELSLPSTAVINVNGTIASDNDPISDGDFVATVTNNKTGGQ
tara:strand:- start:1949 stop:2155 length:207 start_codon:yes stop_codon:yes gene_type:complete